MRIASYNIQFGTGLDLKYDLARIAASLEGADLIALQEVTRGFPKNGERDMVEEIAALFPDFFLAYGPGCDIHLDHSRQDGRIVERRLQFGNMILSRFPLLATRHLLLPRSRTYERINYQRSALEAVIDTPVGPLRFYSVHLDHVSPRERISQLRFLKDRLFGFVHEGGAVTGSMEFGLADPPMPENFLIMGDFNMEPETPEYLEMVGERDTGGWRSLRDGVAVDLLDRLKTRDEKSITWTHQSLAEGEGMYLDYAFAHPGLVPLVKSGHVDLAAKGSDHFPVWVELQI
ncbi:endonuclease [Martelella alba]|uniref:Endonuclease n=1 Tax=Martelella alba TaxID=2590451 RepID=A0A506UDG4_9HYPH|nr:endonuclease/exonuclease/phosphatase family protein [Martelella alba]TPW31446.1 endonuclease [Martelella alba]